MPFTHPFRYGLLSLLAVLGMVGIVSVPPDTASGLLAGRMLELHLLLELFAIVIAALVVTVSWHTLDRQLDHSANALLAGFVVVIGCDLMHALTYEGMPPLLTESSTPQAIFFWLMGRSFEVLTLGAVAAGLAPRWPRAASLGIGLVVAVATIAFGSFALDRFPVTFVPGEGVTPFKAGYEYVLVGLNGLLALVLWRRAKSEQSRQPALLALSCLFMGLGGFAFTAYVAPSDFQNVVGHVYKVTAYALLYRATFITSIRAPFEALRLSEARVRESQARMYALGTNLPHSVLYQVVLEPDGHRRFTEVSDSVERVCGVRVADVLRDPVTMYGSIHPDDMANLAATEQRCAETLQVFDCEARFCRPDGSVGGRRPAGWAPGALLGGPAGSPTSPTAPKGRGSAAGWSSSSAKCRRWSPSARWPAASPTTSTTCSLPSWATPTWPGKTSRAATRPMWRSAWNRSSRPATVPGTWSTASSASAGATPPGARCSPCCRCCAKACRCCAPPCRPACS